MENYYLEFNELLFKNDRYGCINYVKELLENKKISIVDLYELIIGPSMCSIGEKVLTEQEKVWQEHLHAGIVRSVIENCYPYVFLESTKKNKINKKVIVLSPTDEYHEIGPRMVFDFFTMLGFDATYIGVNTPKEDFLLAVKNLKPNLIAISISNYYNVFTAKDYIDFIRENTDNNFKVVVGGCAFNSDKEAYKKIGADFQAKTFEDLENIGRVI